MNPARESTLSIIGAGSVGTSVAYAALIRNSALQVVLNDINRAKVDAEVLDLAHGMPFTGASRISGGSAVFILVTNPCDVLTVVAAECVDLPPGRLFSSGTGLDSARLRWLIAEAAGIAAQNVHALIVGEHGDSVRPRRGAPKPAKSRTRRVGRRLTTACRASTGFADRSCGCRG